MKNIIVIIFVLLFTLSVSADTYIYYIDETGNDSTGDGSQTTPWKTINKAINVNTATVGDTVDIRIITSLTTAGLVTFNNTDANHNGINFIIEPNSAATASVNITGSNGVWIQFTGVTAGSLTLKRLVGTRANAGWPDKIISYANGKGMNLNVQDCNFISSGTNEEHFIYQAADAETAAARDINITGSYINILHTNLNLARSDAVSIINSTLISRNANGISVRIGSNLDSLTVTNSNLLPGTGGNEKGITQVAGTTTIGYVRISKAYISTGGGCIELWDGIGHFYLQDSNLTSTGIYVPTVQLGEYNAANVGTGFGQIEISDCNIFSSGNSALYLQYGADAAIITRNKTRGITHSFRLESSYNQVSYNYCRGALAMFVVGDYQVINNNTCYQDYDTTSTACLVGVPGGETTMVFPHGCKIYNNIFVTTGTTGYAYWDYEGQSGIARGVNTKATSSCVPSRRNGETDLMSDWQDYNIYWNTNSTSKICRLGSNGTLAADCNTIAAMRAIWNQYNLQYGSINDTHSVIADPLFVNAATGDFRLLSGSPARNAGVNDPWAISSGRLNMGAWQDEQKNHSARGVNH